MRCQFEHASPRSGDCLDDAVAIISTCRYPQGRYGCQHIADLYREEIRTRLHLLCRHRVIHWEVSDVAMVPSRTSRIQ